VNKDEFIFRRAKRKGRNPSINMETVVLNRRAKRKVGIHQLVLSKAMRRAKRDGRNPSTGATLSDRFDK
jgi:nucleoid DNA-binding protein